MLWLLRIRLPFETAVIAPLPRLRQGGKPYPLIGLVGAASELAGRLRGDYPALNREKAREIRHACTICSSEKARREVGYRPGIPLADGVAETIDWYREQGWV